MKKRVLSILLAGLTALGMMSAAAAIELQDASGRVTVGKDMTDMTLQGNAMGNYVRGNGSNHSPAQSFLYVNEDGGVSVVQHQSRGGSVTVADFDAELNFLRTRDVSVLGRYSTYNGWGAFYAGEKYNYMIFLDSNDLDEDVLRIDCYTKDWSKWDGAKYPDVILHRGLIANDLDVTESNGSLFLVSNYTIRSSDPEENGHQANFRMQINSETLTLERLHTGVDAFDGYCSHSFVPEVAVNNGIIYTYDRSDRNPGNGIFMTAFQGGLAATKWKYRMIQSMTFGDWGSQGNAIPAGDGVLTAYAYAPAAQSNTATNVYLHYTTADGSTNKVQVNQNGGAGTPYVAAVDKNTGFVLWNPDLFSSETRDNLYYAAYTISGSSVSVGSVNMAEGHYLSDCEPIAFDGGLIWYTVEGGELIFHKLHPTEGLSTVMHHNWVTVDKREPTCSEVGLTEGVQCGSCGEWLVEQEEIPVIDHTEEIVPAVAPTCTSTGLTEGTKCSVCSQWVAEQKTVEKLPHTEEIIPAVEPTCTEKGLTEGRKCTVCGQTTVRQESVSRLGHELEEVPRVEPTYYTEGHTRGFICTRCGEWRTEPTVLPRLQVTVRGCSAMAAWGSLSVDLNRDDNVPLDVICVFYDAEGRMMEIQMNDDLGKYYGGSFKLMDGAASFALFFLDNNLIPVGEAYRSELVVTP